MASGIAKISEARKTVQPTLPSGSQPVASLIADAARPVSSSPIA